MTRRHEFEGQGYGKGGFIQSATRLQTKQAPSRARFAPGQEVLYHRRQRATVKEATEHSVEIVFPDGSTLAVAPEELCNEIEDLARYMDRPAKPAANTPEDIPASPPRLSTPATIAATRPGRPRRWAGTDGRSMGYRAQQQAKLIESWKRYLEIS